MARIDEIRQEIRENELRIEDLRDELWELEKEESKFYIYKEVVGDADYWDEYYHPIGFVTTEKAMSLIDDDEASPFGDSVFAVDEEKYRLFVDWYYVRKSISNLNAVRKSLIVDGISTDLEDEASKIFKLIGLQYESFQHPGDPINI